MEHFREKQIYDQTLAIPFPYTEKNADWWINKVAMEARSQGESINWAIREPQGKLIGGIGFLDLVVKKSHRAEIGYWLAKPYWGRGLMSSAVSEVSTLGFAKYGLQRITAHVFSFNFGSARALAKAEFQCEGTLRKHYKKDGNVFDGRLFAKSTPWKHPNLL